MVVGALQRVPTKGRISVMKIQNFTVQKRHSVIKLSYGFLLLIIGIVMAAINPIHVIAHYLLEMREGSFIFKMWESPTYEMITDVWVFNYTNVDEYLSGAEKVMRVEEVGPFRYKEIRKNHNLRIDRDRGVLLMNPETTLEFMEEGSLAHPDNVTLKVPNIPLLAISTLLSEKIGYLGNVGAYFSMKALSPKLFKDLTAQEILWGYYDPVVTVANGLLPGWIDFNKIGVLDRIYANRPQWAEVEIGDPTKMYSLRTWDNSTGLTEQGFTDWNSSIPCNRISGTFEGFMLPPNFEKDRSITIFRKQACRSFPFNFVEEKTSDFGFTSYRFEMQENAFSHSSPYDCACQGTCPPEGFIDIHNCYYGFPFQLSKPHYLGVTPEVAAHYAGMNPDPHKHSSFYEMQPTIGVPVQFAIKIQINLAVRTSSANPITAPLNDKIVPLFWLQVTCPSPPSDVIVLLKLRLIYGPPLYIIILIIIFVSGSFLGGQGFYRIWKPRYKIIPPAEPMVPIVRKRSLERRRSSVHENIAFKDDDMEKEAVSLLAINEEDNDFVELLICDDDDEFE